MNQKQVKRAFRRSGSPMSGYGMRKFLRTLSDRLPKEHEGHKATGMLFTHGTISLYSCSCGGTFNVFSTPRPK